MNTGDKVTLHEGTNHAPAIVGDTSPNETTIRLHVQPVPRWIRQKLRARGIFIGPDADWPLFLFRDHAGTWTDMQTLSHYTITQ